MQEQLHFPCRSQGRFAVPLAGSLASAGGVIVGGTIHKEDNVKRTGSFTSALPGKGR